MDILVEAVDAVDFVEASGPAQGRVEAFREVGGDDRERDDGLGGLDGIEDFACAMAGRGRRR